MAKATLGMLIFLAVFLLDIPRAIPADIKTGIAQKSSNKKSGDRHKAVTARSSRTTTRALHRKGSLIDLRGRLIKKAGAGNRRRVIFYRRTPQRPVLPTAGELAGLNLTRDPLMLNSNVAFMLDQSSSKVLYEKNSGVALPIASITKLMTGLVVLESGQNMNEMLEITEDDIDSEKHSFSKLQTGTKLARADLLRIALMSSENRAASALGRNYAGGLPAFVTAMNATAKTLGMTDTRYVDATGLSDQNVASARDLAKLVIAALGHPLLGQYSTTGAYEVDTGERVLRYVNSNRLVNNADWEIGLQKTGYLSSAGGCLVMQTKIEDHRVVMVFLDAKRKRGRIDDASRLRNWMLEKSIQLRGKPAPGE
jgi:D-alanyl-D-alanine endopeptidase (penicillin-binding protein 7)